MNPSFKPIYRSYNTINELLRASDSCIKISPIGMVLMTMNNACKYFAVGALLLMSAIAVHAERRVGLIIGNGAYQNTAALPNPIKDAEDMAGALREVGFDVTAEKNVDKRSIEMAMARFGRMAQDADAALFYYAGHGIQYRGVNYLMPVDARLEHEFSINYKLIRIDDVLFALERARGVKLFALFCRRRLREVL